MKFICRAGRIAIFFALLAFPLNAQDTTQPLTGASGVKLMSRVSQDGSLVAYIGDKNQDSSCMALDPDNQEVYLVSADGLQLQKLTDNAAEETSPSISADGGLVAFARRVSTDAFSVFVVDTLNLTETQISAAVQSGSSSISSEQPMIGANGESVVYVERGDIFIAAADGSSNPSNLTDSPNVDDHFPSISADGRRIAFSSNGDYLGTNPGGDEEIFVMSWLGTSLRQLTNNEVPDLHPWISGDGSTVAFERELVGQQQGPNPIQYDVLIVSADGGAFETNLTSSSTISERFPSLNFSGSRVAFEVRNEGEASYAWMNTDGTELVTVSGEPSQAVNGVNATLTEDGGLVAFSAQDGASECRQVFLSGNPPNLEPLANGGGDQVVQVGQTVTLDASGSNDPNADTLTFSWKIITRPEGSSVALSDTEGATTTFVVDVAGEYLIDLVVSDGRDGVDSDKVHVIAQDEVAAAPAGGQSIEQVIDLNENKVIDDEEIVEAISLWVLGTPVADTDGLIVDDEKILQLIELWILGAPFEPVES